MLERGCLLVLLSCTSLISLSAGTVVDFESFSDGDLLTTQVPGLTFSNTIVFGPFSLNTAEFPPFSGTNVASDFGGPISIAFLSPVFSVSGYFTYTEPLTFTAFDASNVQIGSATSAFSNNLGLSGDPGSSPNEFLQIQTGTPIAAVTIQADPNGGSFTLDDLTYDSTPASTVPEPDVIYLFLSGAVLLGLVHRRRVMRCRAD